MVNVMQSKRHLTEIFQDAVTTIQDLYSLKRVGRDPKSQVHWEHVNAIGLFLQNPLSPLLHIQPDLCLASMVDFLGYTLDLIMKLFPGCSFPHSVHAGIGSGTLGPSAHLAFHLDTSWSCLQTLSINSCDQNLNICCELLELNSKIQGQLFTILNVTAREGGQYAGVETLKSRFLPWLGTCFSNSSCADSSFALLQDSLERDKRMRQLSSSQEKELNKLESQLASTRVELNSVRQDLLEAQMELEETKTKSATTLLATEDEILQLRADLRAAHEKIELRNLVSEDDHQRQIRLLKDEVSILSAEKSILHGRLSRSRSPSPIRHSSRSTSPFTRSESPTAAQLTNASRYSRLLSRFNDVYANDRLDAQNLLRRYIEDLEMVQRIIFIATAESFHAAKMAFRQFKLRVRKSLSPSHMGPESLEDAVIDYIVRNLDLYDVQSSVNDVISAMNVNPKISFPAEVDFILISGFIREVCRVAFAMQTLEAPLDIAFAVDGELFSETKYRRTYDSELTAPLVFYHVWPSLMENDIVVVKGEAVTKRGALWSPRKSRSRSCSPLRSRSVSPGRTLASRSRSPSPIRSGTSRF